MSDNNEKEVLKAYEEYLAYFLNNDMDGVNSLVKFPITSIADGESKLLDAFPVTPKEMMDTMVVYRLDLSCQFWRVGK